MMKHKFIAPSINIENFDEAAVGIDIPTDYRADVNIGLALSNSFGFGGTNCSLAFRSYDG